MQDEKILKTKRIIKIGNFECWEGWANPPIWLLKDKYLLFIAKFSRDILELLADPTGIILLPLTDWNNFTVFMIYGSAMKGFCCISE